MTTKKGRFYQRDRGENALFITLVPKVFKQRFLIRWLNNFECSNVLTTNFNLQNLCVTIGNVHRFIGQCLIPLDPWLKIRICVNWQLSIIFETDMILHQI